MLKKIIKSWSLSLQRSIYPSLCLHCTEALDDDKLLCSTCSELISLLSNHARCPRCFTPLAEGIKGSCLRCRNASPLSRCAAAIEYQGPAVTLIRRFKYHGYTHLAEALASLITAQFIQLAWPIPDLIIPVPQSWLRSFTRGFHPSALLAQIVAQQLQRPAHKLLRRRIGDLPQAALSQTQRHQLSTHSITLKKPELIQDKIILLIDDVMTTGTTLHRCAEALSEACPKRVYAMTVCM